jgi:hypothetical protein
MRGTILTSIVLLCIGLVLGCSGGVNPVEPVAGRDVATGDASHNMWGLWQFKADPVKETLDVIPLRGAEMHLNALPFLEPPALVNITLESLQFNGNIIETDIGIKHPFLGLNEFTGFDVCGILITNGSVTGFDDPDLVMAGDGDTRLLNPDGWTRWWNPAEFPVNDGTISAYNDGLLGTPDSTANFNSTLNAYKLFADDFANPDDPVSSLGPETRCVFSAGQKNIRHYTIELGDIGLIFNYAVDASWQFPQGPAPWTVPDDFAPEANRVEAWNVSIDELGNTLWNDGSESGGDLSLSIDVWDHYNADMNTVKVESSGNFTSASSSTAVDGGDGYSTYEIDITDASPSPDSIELFITVESEATGYQGLLPGKKVSAYFKYTASVSPENPGPVECGTGNYTSVTNTPFADQTVQQIKYAVGWLLDGPYAGQMIVQYGAATLRRYDTDHITPLNGQLFLTLPSGSWSGLGLMYHIDVEPVTSRVTVVPDGLGNNNSMLVFDDAGNLLSPATGLSVGAGRKILAMHSNGNGDLWLLTAHILGATDSNQSKLERWVYQAGPPYYVYDPAYDLSTDDIFGKPSYYGLSIKNDVAGLAICRSVQRIYVFQQAEIGEHNGWLNVFDINSDGPPTYRPDLSTQSLFSLPTYRAENDNQKSTYGGIWVDHEDPVYEKCRILVYGRNYPSLYVMLAKLDGDADKLDETSITSLISPYTFGINYDSDMTLKNVTFVGYPNTACYMGAPPPDW